MHWGRHSITAVAPLPEMHSHNLIMRKHQTTHTERAFHKCTHQTCQGHEKQQTHWGSLEKTKGAWQVNLMWDIGLDLGPEKDIRGKLE